GVGTRWAIRIRRRSVQDHRLLLCNVIAVARSILIRSLAAKSRTKKSTTLRFLAARFAGAYVLRLLYRRLGEMSGQRLVGWLQSLAIADQAAFQPYFTGHSCSIQIRATDPRNFDLSNRTRLPIFHLDKEDPLVLVGVYFGNARGDWVGNGNVPFCPCNDRFESCCLRYRNEQTATFHCRGHARPKHGATHVHFGPSSPWCSIASR